MEYANVTEGVFLSRPNRFIAEVSIDGRRSRVHVKNTGRCSNVLKSGAEVALQKSGNPDRKTAFDLIAVKDERLGWVNLDSSAPNTVVREWLSQQALTLIKPEYTYGASRIDFYLEQGERKILMEVKGCTLEYGGIGFFPDAPTERGVKHLRELAGATEKGFECYAAFVIQMNGIREVKPNARIHAEFAEEFERAVAAGVKPLFLECRVERDSLRIISTGVF